MKLVIAIAILLAAAIPSLALDVVSEPPIRQASSSAAIQPAYGTSATSSLVVAPWDFIPVQSTVTYAAQFFPSSIYRTNATGGFHLQAPIHLPSGARITAFEVKYCDTNATEDLAVFLQIHDLTAGDAINGAGTFISTATPGCSTGVVQTDVTINNATQMYILQAALGAGDNSNRLGAIRVYYQLQVSQPPLTPTFADVPASHPFYQFIEALGASGITAGCGGGNFCPDAPLTRGQMAVFLSRALGLHWAP